MDANMMKKLQTLLGSEDFGKEIENVQSAEELQRAFAAHGVELTVDEVREICVAITVRKDGTLDEDALEQVSGGGVLTSLAIGAGACAVGYAVGYVAGRIVKKYMGSCG